MGKLTTEEKVARYRQQGFCRADTSHLPERIQHILETIRLRPNIKECFANCQRFVIGVADHGLDVDVEYHEGYVMGMIPFEHAWLVVDGERVDITIDDADERPLEYFDSKTYTVEEIRENVLETEQWQQMTTPWDMTMLHPLCQLRFK